MELITFWDMFSANTALDLLDQAELEYQITGKRIGGDVFKAVLNVSLSTSLPRTKRPRRLYSAARWASFPCGGSRTSPRKQTKPCSIWSKWKRAPNPTRFYALLRNAGIEGHIAAPGKDAGEADWLQVEVRSRVYTEALKVVTDGFLSGEAAACEAPDGEAP